MGYKAVINGKTYNTETARRVCRVDCPVGVGVSDFRWHDTHLYQTKKGAFFVAGLGGAMSMWSQALGTNGSRGGGGVRALTEQEARQYMEAAGVDAETFSSCGLPVEEA